MQPLIGRLDHIAIAADNTIVMAAWYQQALNFHIIAETGPNPGQNQKTFLIGPIADGLAHGSMLEIMPRNTTPRHDRANHDAGISHIAWQVPDFDAALAHLRQHNVAFLGEIVQAVGGGRLISFSDCEGNMLQIVERLDRTVTLQISLITPNRACLFAAIA